MMIKLSPSILVLVCVLVINWDVRAAFWPENPHLTAQKQNYRDAVASGTLFKTKSKAIEAFRRDYTDQYPSKYETKPTNRPAHIPYDVRVGWGLYKVVYYYEQCEYGYWVDDDWVTYDVMSDGVMISRLMTKHNYLYDRDDGPWPGMTPVPRSWWSDLKFPEIVWTALFFMVILSLLVVFIVIPLIIECRNIIRKWKERREKLQEKIEETLKESSDPMFPYGGYSSTELEEYEELGSSVLTKT